MDDFSSADRALVVAHHVVEMIGDDDLHRPTPCREWDVRALADHLIDTIARLGAAAELQTTVPDGGPIAGRILYLTQPLLAEWRSRGLGDRVVFSGRTLPAHLALGILSLELLVHGWDFAVALERPLHVVDAHAAHILGLASQTLNTESRTVAGFDPPVPVSADASPLDQLIAFSGRNPLQLDR